MPKLLQLIPEYRDYVWGGTRLRPGGGLTAEAWVVYAGDRVAAGPWDGQTLADVASRAGAALLGEPALRRGGGHFPLLIKLLDCAQWLSLQVHPSDAQARQLEGPGLNGKTEAWHVLEAAPDARLIAGLKPGLAAAELAAAIRGGTLLDWAQYRTVRAGDSVFIPPGTIHALGPGLLIYEVQQMSDLTYRVFDWNRPQTGGRVLHIEKSLAVADPAAAVGMRPWPAGGGEGCQTLVTCPYFTLDLVTAHQAVLALDTRRTTFHALTVREGEVEVICDDERVRLGRLETVIVPAASGRYTLRPISPCQVLKASVEPD